MRMKWWLATAAAVVMGGFALAGQETRVLSDRVNLRARPLDDAEVAGQVGQGDVLTLLKIEGDWAEVQAPSNAGVWVKGEFIQSGRVKADKVNIRSGPGVSYRSVGTLRGGTEVQVRETRGEWMSIVPPGSISLWIKKEFLDISQGVPPVAATAPSAGPGVVAAETSAPAQTAAGFARELPEGLRPERLAPVLGQGAVMERQGVVGRVPMAIFRGVEYRLVEKTEGGETTVTYVRGRDDEMAALTGKRIAVKGRGWWLRGERWPLLYPDTVAELKAE